ncbi:MAG: YjfB family protein [Betaproteobacteria bacterium]
MDVTGIASLASNIATTGLAQTVGVAVARKALDIEAATVAALVQAIPKPPASTPPFNLGQNIDTTA